MKKLSIILIIGAIAMGYFDGGDMTAAFILLLFVAPAIFSRKGRVHSED